MSEVHVLTGAYALDALDEVERAMIGRHLAECDACAQEVAEFAETVTRLSDPLVVTPPGRLRDNVLAEVSRTRQVGPPRRQAAPASAPPWRRWAAASAAAAVLAVGTAVGGWAVERRHVNVEQARVAAEQERSRRIADVLAAPDAQLRTGAMAGGRATIVTSASRDAAVAVLSDLNDPGRQEYQLWLVNGRTYRPVGLVGPGQRGGSVLLGPLAGADTFGVSLEKAGGSRTGQPSGPPVGAMPLT